MPVQRIQFTEDKDLIFEDKLQREELDISLERFGETGSTDDRHNSSRPKHARTEENVTTVDELLSLLNQEDQTQTLRSTRQISRKAGPKDCRRHSPRSWSGVFFILKTPVAYYC